MNTSVATATSSNEFRPKESTSAPVANNTRRIPGLSIDLLGRIEEVSFVAEYFDSGTRIVFGNEKCMLNRAYSTKFGQLVHVQLSSETVKPLHPLFSMVQGGFYIGNSAHGCFVRIAEGDMLTAFYPDGKVAAFKSLTSSTKAFKYSLSAVEAFAARLDFIRKMLDEAAKVEGDGKVPMQDRNMHELASIIGMSKRYPDMRTQVIDYVTGLNIPLRHKVFEHFRQACTSVGDMDLWMKIRVFADTQRVGTTSTPSLPKGKPAKEKARKAARRERDAEFHRQKCKDNPPRNDDTIKHGNKKKGGKK